ncbi:MAG: site-specific integrase, partial [Burkholderiales bacterium]
MASIYKHRSNKWIAVIRRTGLKTRTKSFSKHTDAKRWATSIEANQSTNQLPRTQHTLHEAFERYEADYITKFKSIKTARWELQFFKTHLPNLPLDEFQSTHAVNYRDFRLSNGVSGSSINRELGTLSRLFDIAMKEWQWSSHNPIKQITRPKHGKHRTRRPTQEELTTLHNECSQSGNDSIWRMIELAVETGMRQGELLGLTKDSVNLNEHFAHLSETKNGESRHVPLSRRACALIAAEIKETQSGQRLFSRWSSGDGFRSTYKRICKRVDISDLRFH